MPESAAVTDLTLDHLRPPSIGRRTLLAGLGALGLAAALPGRAEAAAGAYTPGPTRRRLKLRHMHTRETIDVVYVDHNRYLPEALTRLDHFLRDHRDGTEHVIDPALLDFLHDLSRDLQVRKPIRIVCGFRSKRSNDLLRARSSGVAKRSLHMEGRALDIRLSGRSVDEIARTALAMQRGGVGRYTRSNFVHIDTGRVRTWGT